MISFLRLQSYEQKSSISLYPITICKVSCSCFGVASCCELLGQEKQKKSDATREERKQHNSEKSPLIFLLLILITSRRPMRENKSNPHASAAAATAPTRRGRREIRFPSLPLSLSSPNEVMWFSVLLVSVINKETVPNQNNDYHYIDIQV